MKSLSLNLGIAYSLSRPEAASQWPKKIFETLGSVFVPRHVLIVRDGKDEPTLERLASTKYQNKTLWAGEEILDDVLTHFTPGDSLLDELDARLTGAGTLELTAHGALRHRAPGTAAPAFYGRWRHAAWLETFAKVYFTWSDQQRELEIAFPLGGYPLTRSRLTSEEIVDGDVEVARENALAIINVLGRLRHALGLAENEATWSQSGDYSSWYPDDADACERIWLPKLRNA